MVAFLFLFEWFACHFTANKRCSVCGLSW